MELVRDLDVVVQEELEVRGLDELYLAAQVSGQLGVPVGSEEAALFTKVGPGADGSEAPRAPQGRRVDEDGAVDDLEDASLLKGSRDASGSIQYVSECHRFMRLGRAESVARANVRRGVRATLAARSRPDSSGRQREGSVVRGAGRRVAQSRRRWRFLLGR